jgi:hypothetical protein
VPGSWLLEQPFLIVLDSRTVSGREEPPIPDEWLDEAELYLLDAGYAGSFARTIERRIEEWPTINGGRVIVDPRPR